VEISNVMEVTGVSFGITRKWAIVGWDLG